MNECGTKWMNAAQKKSCTVTILDFNTDFLRRSIRVWHKLTLFAFVPRLSLRSHTDIPQFFLEAYDLFKMFNSSKLAPSPRLNDIKRIFWHRICVREVASFSVRIWRRIRYFFKTLTMISLGNQLIAMRNYGYCLLPKDIKNLWQIIFKIYTSN